jgi:bacitracin transport system permease protein
VAVLLNLLYCELLKLKRSKMLLISFLGALVAPALMFANGVNTHFLRPDNEIKMTGFYDSCIMFSMLMFGLIVYAVITAYLFSREYTENTLKTIITVPVKKRTFIISKFIMLFIWIMFLTLISWISIYILTALFNAIFGLEEFYTSVALIYLGKMMFSGVLMFLTISPIAFLSIWTKGFVVPLISAATIAIANVILSNSELQALFPWTATHLIVKNGFTQIEYSKVLVIGLIALVSILGLVLSIVYFQREDIK